VYRDGELPDDVPTRVRAASLWLSGDLVACHSTAALLWGFDLRSTATAAAERLVRLAQLVRYADDRVESPMESRMRWRFLDARLPAPDVQIEVAADGRRHRLDVGWRECRLAAEFDGLEAHMTRQQLAQDRDRHNWLTERGWTLLHFTAVDVYRHWERTVATVRRNLAAASSAIMAP
jgi:very-short-patch-repair endonuclease